MNLESNNNSNGKIRYRSGSASELDGQQHSKFPIDGRIMKKMRQESVMDKMYRFRGVIFVVGVPLLLISFVLLLMPRVPLDNNNSEDVDTASSRFSDIGSSSSKKRFAVVFDAGSSGSRVHVFCFDRNMDLVPIGGELELFVQKKPGLSSYASDPEKAANSLKPLLEEAERVVPKALRSKTPVRVGATAGLRQLPGDAADRILQAVKDFLSRKSSLKFFPEWVTVLDGAQEGSYQWITLNYLLGRVGKSYSETVGIVDLGGGSVQMAYAVSDEMARSAPAPPEGEDSYIKELTLKGEKYHLYVHSYLHYGLLAARAEILKLAHNGESTCILTGYKGKYKYGGNEYQASSPSSGSDFESCNNLANEALNINAACTHMKCTFGGIWNGGGGDGQKNLFVASFFFDRAAEAGFINGSLPVAVVSPADFMESAKKACKSNIENARNLFPHVDQDQLPYLCMDLSYQYSLLVDGFGIDAYRQITLVKKVQYKNSYVEAAWPLGSAIELVS